MATVTIQDVADGATAYCGGTLQSSHSGFDSPPNQYQWYRNGQAINGATSPGYGTKRLDVGQSITCVATGLVAAVSTPVTSNAVVVRPPRPAFCPFPVSTIRGKISLSTVDSTTYQLKIDNRHMGSFPVDTYGLPTLANVLAYRFNRRLFDPSFLEESLGAGVVTTPGVGEGAPTLGGVAEVGDFVSVTPPTGFVFNEVTYEWYHSSDNFVNDITRILNEYGSSFRIPVTSEGKWLRVKALLVTYTGATVSVREVWSNIIGPVVPDGGAVFDPPTLTDGGTAYGTWVASTEPDVGTNATPGWDENAIGSWITPTHDVLNTGGTMYIGVIARHMNGIAKVQFSLNNGAWVDVLTESTNTNDQGRGVSTTAYWVKVTAAGSTAKRNEVRAKIIPANAGKPRILQGALTSSYYYSGSGTTYQHSFEFYNTKSGYEHVSDPVEVYCDSVNGNDTNNGLTAGTAVATLKQAFYRLGGSVGGGSTAHDLAGKTVWLAEGSYNFEGYSFGTKMQSDLAFVHVRKLPAANRDNVIFNGEHYSTATNGLRMRFVALHDITVTPRSGTYLNGSLDSIDIYGSTYGPCFKNDSQGVLWLDNCKFTSPNGTSAFNGTFNKTDHPNPSSSANINSLADPTAFGLTSGWKTTIVTFPTVSYFHSTPCGGLLVKHVNIEYVAEDIIRNAQAAYKVTASNIRFLTTEMHPDVWQSYRASANIENQFCIDVTAHAGVGAQGFFCHGDTALFRDIWIEKWRCEVDNDGTDFANYGTVLAGIQLQQPCRHVVLKDVRIQETPKKFLVYNSGGASNDFTATNVYFRGCFSKLDAPVTSDTIILQSGDGGPSLGTWPGTLPWTDNAGVKYETL